MKTLFPPLPPRIKPRNQAVLFIELILVTFVSLMLYRLGYLINAEHPGQVPEYKLVIAPLLPFALWWFISCFLFGRQNDRFTASAMPKWLQWTLLVGMLAYGILA